MSEEDDYFEEAYQDGLRAEAAERFKRLPEICQQCRWWDAYYTESCMKDTWPENGRCGKYCRDWKFAHRLPRWLKLRWWRLQAWIWGLRQKGGL